MSAGPGSQGRRWRVEPLERRVRITSGPTLLADSDAVLRVVEAVDEVRYYLPAADIDRVALVSARTEPDLDQRGPATVWSVRTGGREVASGAWSYRVPVPGRPDLRSYVSFAWPAMDRMHEEDEEVSVHPRNPCVRVDVLASSRRVEVRLGGVVLARTTRPLLLVETTRPDRWYVPAQDVLAGLVPSATRTECPYKGVASYWSVEVPDGEDLAWRYTRIRDRAALPLSGAVCFAAERVDTVVDGVPLPRPARRPGPRHLTGDWVRGHG